MRVVSLRNPASCGHAHVYKTRMVVAAVTCEERGRLRGSRGSNAVHGSNMALTRHGMERPDLGAEHGVTRRD